MKGGPQVKRCYAVLRIVMWSVIGVFIGGSLYKWYDYKTHPDLYAMQSAPWYVGIEISALCTAAIVMVMLIMMWAIRKRISK